MNQEEIIKMAREAGANGMKPVSARQESDPITAYRLTEDALVRFAALVAAKAAQDEREQCAMVCSGIADSFFAIDGEDDAMCAACDCEEAILARGQ